MKHAPVALILISGFALASHAATSPPDSLRACSQVQDPGERLRCYDAQMGAPAPGATSAQPSASTPAPAVTGTVPPGTPASTPSSPTVTRAREVPPPPSQATPAKTFGEDELPQTKRAPVPEAERLLRSSITSIRGGAANVMYISLANGQVWRQEGAQITMFFHPGDDVSIEKGFLGQYRMSTPRIGAKNWVRVDRIR